MQAEVEALLKVQSKDIEILEAKRKINHQQQRQQQLNKLIEQASARNRKLHENLESKRLEGRRLSDEVDHLDEHIREQDRKLAEDIVSFKEIDTIKSSIAHGRQHIEQLEETALSLLDEIEADEAIVAQKDQDFKEKITKFDEDLRKIHSEIEAQQQQLQAAQEQRNALWEQLPDHLKNTYARIAQHMPDVVVPVRGQSCDGCKLQLSTQLLQEVRAGNTLVYCEHCSRILYMA